MTREQLTALKQAAAQANSAYAKALREYKKGKK
jgi:hypothetical protein